MDEKKILEMFRRLVNMEQLSSDQTHCAQREKSLFASSFEKSNQPWWYFDISNIDILHSIPLNKTNSQGKV